MRPSCTHRRLAGQRVGALLLRMPIVSVDVLEGHAARAEPGQPTDLGNVHLVAGGPARGQDVDQRLVVGADHHRPATERIAV